MHSSKILLPKCSILLHATCIQDWLRNNNKQRQNSLDKYAVSPLYVANPAILQRPTLAI